MIRVLVVDDSPSVRALLAHILGADPALHVVGCAVDGAEGVEMAKQLRPDVITMDLQMPNMDGYEATRRIMQVCPVPVVVVSGADSHAEVEASFRAIEAGALVLVRRPPGPSHPEHAESARALLRTVKSMAEVRVVRRWDGSAASTRSASASASASVSASASASGPALAPPPPAPRRLVLLGASTGGPTVLRDILAQLGPDFALPLVIVQHIAPGFSEGLAEWLTQATGFPVLLATHGQRLEPGRAYLAPDGRQLGITRLLEVALSYGAPEHGMRPAVDHLFRSLPVELRTAAVAVLLTGMGKDGALELKRLRDDGAVTIVQDRGSAAVYGMPGEALRLGAAMLVLEPVRIGKALNTIANQPEGRLAVLGL